MFDGVKLAPSCDSQHDKAKPRGHSKAKTDIDEGHLAQRLANRGETGILKPDITNAA
jgi:hypothetical protein